MRPIAEDPGYQELVRQLRELTIEFEQADHGLMEAASDPVAGGQTFMDAEQRRDKVAARRNLVFQSIASLKENWR